MPTTDRSQTERIRRIRSTIQAVRRTECLTCPEEGPQGPTDQSTWLSRRFGQMTYYTQTASGATVDKSCCTESSPNIFIITACNQTQTFTGVNIGDFITFINNSPDSVIIIYLNTVSQINVSTFSILVPTAEVSTIVDITDDVQYQAACFFDLETNTVTHPVPANYFYGRNATQNVINIIYNGSPYIVPPGEFIGPFGENDSYTVD